MPDNQEPAKKIQIESAARQLFWKYGLKRVTVEEICRAAGVSKMTFYNYFRNKTDLARFIIDRLTEEGFDAYHAIMNRDISFAEKVEQTIELKMKQTENLSMEFFNDLHRHGPHELRQHLETRSRESSQLILKDYTEAQKRGDIRQDLNPAFILYFLNHISDMVDDPQLLALYETPQQLIYELTNFFFYGILPHQSGRLDGHDET